MRCFELVGGAGEAWPKAVASGRASEGTVNGVGQRELARHELQMHVESGQQGWVQRTVKCTRVVLVTVDAIREHYSVESRRLADCGVR